MNVPQSEPMRQNENFEHKTEPILYWILTREKGSIEFTGITIVGLIMKTVSQKVGWRNGERKRVNTSVSFEILRSWRHLDGSVS